MSYIDDCNYYGDGRVRAGERRADSILRHIDAGRKLATVTVWDGDTSEEVEVPILFEVCPTCEGTGRHVNPAVDAGGLSAEDFAEDPDFAEDYMGGVYDVRCYGCGGERVVPVLDRARIDADLLRRLDEEEAERDAFRRVQEAERRMGA